MPEHVIKIIKPQDQVKNAITLFDSHEKLIHWQE